jgi:hypothetical protein
LRWNAPVARLTGQQLARKTDIKMSPHLRERAASGARILPEHFKADGSPKAAYDPEKAREICLAWGGHVYRCNFCGAHHVGKWKRDRAAAARAAAA